MVRSCTTILQAYTNHKPYNFVAPTDYIILTSNKLWAIQKAIGYAVATYKKKPICRIHYPLNF